MADFKYEVVEHIAVLSNNKKTGWNKELNFVSWANREPRFDIREWSEDHTSMSKGVSFTKEELIALRDILNGLKL